MEACTIILHTADWHIDGSQFLPDYLYRQELAIQEVFRIAENYEAEVLLVAGDIFNHHIISEEARKLFFKLITDSDKNNNFTSVLINGNHDIYKESNSVVSLFQDVAQSFLSKTYIVDMQPRLIEVGKLSVMAIPYRDELTNDKFKELVRQGYKRHQGKYYVPMAHFMTKGCIRDNGSVSPSGLELPPAKWDYMALGDVHKVQKVGPDAFYSGSPVQHKFGESLPKGVMIVDLKKNKRKFVKIKSPAIRRLITVTEVGKEWPKNAWVRFKGKESPQDLPDEVLKISTEVETEDVVDMELDDITLGLPEFAAARGLKKKSQRKLTKMVERYTERINYEN